MRALTTLLAAAVITVGLAGSPATAAPSTTTDIRLITFNDFHGNLQPPAGSSGRVTLPDGTTVDAGGAAYLATHLRNLRSQVRNSVVFSAGDNVGASPLDSALFHDEPTMDVLNKLGVAASVVGNHEFDEGYRELRRMTRGGCLPDGDGANNQNSCPDAANPFAGADWPYLAANVKFENTGRPILPPYKIRKVKGQKVA
ncbi:MAG: metallophosphoesterase, partial [Actinomycetes bacterium]